MGCIETREVNIRVSMTRSISTDDKGMLVRFQVWLKPLMEKKLEGHATWDKSIEEVSKLEKLDLDGLEIEHVPPEIGKLAALRGLDLHNNKLQVVPAQLSHLENLKYLYLQENELCLVPPEFGQLAMLDWLILSQNKLDTVPSDLGRLSSLIMLCIEDNQLRALPPEYGNLTSLEQLRVARNFLTSIPSQFGQMEKLKVLDLEENRLSTLPLEIGHLRNLKALHVSHNQLESLPREVGQLTTLHELRVGHNRLTALPAELNGLTSLRMLCIEDNNITGPFNLRPLFDRMAYDPEATLQLSGNRFDPINFEDIRWTTNACQVAEAPSDWHAGGRGSKDCEALRIYFDAAEECTGCRAGEAHARFGCCWFQKWISRIERALEAGHRRFVVFTRADRTLGTCQMVEWVYLLTVRQRFPTIAIHCSRVSEAVQVLRRGPGNKAFSGGSLEDFSQPANAPSVLPASLRMIVSGNGGHVDRDGV